MKGNVYSINWKMGFAKKYLSTFNYSVSIYVEGEQKKNCRRNVHSDTLQFSQYRRTCRRDVAVGALLWVNITHLQSLQREYAYPFRFRDTEDFMVKSTSKKYDFPSWNTIYSHDEVKWCFHIVKSTARLNLAERNWAHICRLTFSDLFPIAITELSRK